VFAEEATVDTELAIVAEPGEVRVCRRLRGTWWDKVAAWERRL
jgi:hypothetical protein